MKILLSAYACEPNTGSEPEVGWQMPNQLAILMPQHDFYVITKQNNKQKIELERYPSNLHFIYYELPIWLRFWKKGSRGIRTYYYIWSFGAALYVKRQNIPFDIIHHLTFVTDHMASFMHFNKNKNTNFIWGPIGGNEWIPWKFLDRNRYKLKEIIKGIIQIFTRRFDPFFYICKFRADLVIGSGKYVKKRLRLNTKNNFIVESPIGMKKDFVESIQKENKDTEDFIILSVGRLIQIKNFKLSILAFKLFLTNNPSIRNVKLTIVGKGEDEESLKKLVKTLAIEDKVEFVGKVSLLEVQEYFAKADLFLFPTLEMAGFVILEAMSHYLPVIALDFGGPKEFIIHDKESQLVSVNNSYNHIVNLLSKKIENLYNNQSLRERIGFQNHFDVLTYFTWEAKAKKIKKIYVKSSIAK